MAHFHASIENGADRRHAYQDFASVRVAFYHLQQSFAGAHQAHHIGHVQDDWSALASSFAQTARMVDVRGRGRYQRNPHYAPAPSYPPLYGYRRPPTPRVRVRVVPANTPVHYQYR